MRGKRIAVDVHLWFYGLRYGAQKSLVYTRDIISKPLTTEEIDNKWLSMIYEQCVRWLDIGITPVMVFDGPSPAEKSKTKDNRIAARKEKVDKLEALLLEARSGSVFAINNDVLNKVRALTCSIITMSSDSLQLAHHFFDSLGIPTVIAPGDSEQYCTALCLEGKVSAVYSKDGDNLAHGCPALIKGIGETIYDNRGYACPTFDIVYVEDVLEALELTQEQFRDLCIMAGCDFNTNMPKVGMIRSLALIKKHGSIDNLPTNYDVTCLDHVRCRDLLSCPSCEDVHVHSLNIESWSAMQEDGLRMYNMDESINQFKCLIDRLPTPQDYVIPGLPGPKIVFADDVDHTLNMYSSSIQEI